MKKICIILGCFILVTWNISSAGTLDQLTGNLKQCIVSNCQNTAYVKMNEIPEQNSYKKNITLINYSDIPLKIYMDKNGEKHYDDGHVALINDTSGREEQPLALPAGKTNNSCYIQWHNNHFHTNDSNCIGLKLDKDGDYTTVANLHYYSSDNVVIWNNSWLELYEMYYSGKVIKIELRITKMAFTISFYDGGGPL